MNVLGAIPVYNEVATVAAVVNECSSYLPDWLVVNDGSTDGTQDILNTLPGIARIDHPVNYGYGRALQSAFEFAIARGYEVLVTIDCDFQHQPQLIPRLIDQLVPGIDLVSGSRYLPDSARLSAAPDDRVSINRIITDQLNRDYQLHLTDAFCGFKSYRISALSPLQFQDQRWGMPLELWVQAAWLKWSIVEVAIPRIYLSHARAFGGILDQPEQRLAYYREVIATAEMSAQQRWGKR